MGKKILLKWVGCLGILYIALAGKPVLPQSTPNPQGTPTPNPTATQPPPPHTPPPGCTDVPVQVWNPSDSDITATINPLPFTYTDLGNDPNNAQYATDPNNPNNFYWTWSQSLPSDVVLNDPSHPPQVIPTQIPDNPITLGNDFYAYVESCQNVSPVLYATINQPATYAFVYSEPNSATGLVNYSGGYSVLAGGVTDQARPTSCVNNPTDQKIPKPDVDGLYILNPWYLAVSGGATDEAMLDAWRTFQNDPNTFLFTNLDNTNPPNGLIQRILATRTSNGTLPNEILLNSHGSNSSFFVGNTRLTGGLDLDTIKFATSIGRSKQNGGQGVLNVEIWACCVAIGSETNWTHLMHIMGWILAKLAGQTSHVGAYYTKTLTYRPAPRRSGYKAAQLPVIHVTYEYDPSKFPWQLLPYVKNYLR